jgi:hypothetical protein
VVAKFGISHRNPKRKRGPNALPRLRFGSKCARPTLTRPRHDGMALRGGVYYCHVTACHAVGIFLWPAAAVYSSLKSDSRRTFQIGCGIYDFAFREDELP